MKRYALGIDPGLDGALALLNIEEDTWDTAVVPTLPSGKGSGRIYDLVTMKNVLILAQEKVRDDHGVLRHGNLIVGLEQALPMPNKIKVAGKIKETKMPAKSSFTTGQGYGHWQMALVCLDMKRIEPHPRTWQTILKGVTGGGDTKARALRYIHARYPGVDLRRSEAARVPHKGIVDAMCIACWVAQTQFRGLEWGRLEDD